MKSIKLSLSVIFVITLILIIVVLFLGFRSFQSTETAIKKEFSQVQLVLAEGVARGIEQFFETLVDQLRSLAKLTAIQSFDLVNGQKVLDDHFEELTDEDVNGMSLLDSRGILRMGANNPPSLIGTDFSFRSYFQNAKNATSTQDFFTEFTESPDAGKGEKEVAISVPVFLDQQIDSFLGALMITVPLKKITELFVEPIQNSAGGNIFLLDQEFTILWSPDKNLIGENIMKETDKYPEFQAMLKAMVDGEKNKGEAEFAKFNKQKERFSKVESVKTLFAFAPATIGDQEWSVVTWASADDALKLAKESQNNLVAIIGSVIFIIIFSATVTSVSVVRYETKIKKNEEESRRIATILQESFIKTLPDIKELDIGVGYETAYETEMVGGDFYDIFKIYEDEVVILIGDVVGKGVEATGLTETARSTIRALAHDDHSPSSILTKASKIIGLQFGDEIFVTALLIILSETSGKLKISSAGHPPPSHFNSSVEVMELSYGLPLGVHDSVYKEKIVDIKENEGILVYTDGLTDARNDNEEFFDQSRIEDALKSCKSLDSKSIVEKILYQVTKFAQGKLDDDISLIAIRLTSSNDSNS